MYTDDGYIRLYDIRKLEEGPFATLCLLDATILSALQKCKINIKNSFPFKVTHLEFLGDSINLIVMTNLGVCLILDSFNEKLIQAFAPESTMDGAVSTGAIFGAAFTPDGQYTAVGMESGQVAIYENKKGTLVHTTSKEHIGPVHTVQFNPTRHLLGTAHCNMNFWTPA